MPRHAGVTQERPGEAQPVAGLPNNSLKLTRLAGENTLALGLPRYARMGGPMPEPPGSIARGRYAAFMPAFILSVIVIPEFSLRSARPPLLVVGFRPLATHSPEATNTSQLDTD